LGSPYCYRTDQPIWSGTLFRTDNTGTYQFGNVDGDTLVFDLGAQDGDSSVFFEDDVQRFTFVKSGPDTLTFLGYTDSVYTYVIQHTDLNGLPITSALHGEPIFVGKTLGLVRFFRVDSFPYVIQPLELIGNLDPPLGMYRITTAMIEDHQPGDVLQFSTYQGNVLPTGQPFTYRKTTFLSRTDTPDSVIYDIAWENFNLITNTLNNGVGIARYSKNEVQAQLPFEKFNGSYNFLARYVPESCYPTWYLFSENTPGLTPCEENNCWIAADTQGPPPASNSTLQLGLGITSYFMQPPFFSGQYYFSRRDLVYYVKNGVECGIERHVGVEEHSVDPSVSIQPNPTNDRIRITSATQMAVIEVLNLQGKVVVRMEPRSNEADISFDALGTGVYTARILLMNGNKVNRKLIVAR
jgi:hypothetical protein